MSKLARIMLLIGVVLVITTPAMSQCDGASPAAVYLGGARGAGLVILGGAGIGKISVTAVESMARQPEAAANIQTT